MNEMAWGYLGAFFVVSAIGCAIGFKKPVYFLSVGYGLSVGLLGITYLVTILAGGLSWNAVTVIQCVLLMAYGARLAGFLIAREMKNQNYRKVLEDVRKADSKGKPVPFGGKLAIWIGAAVLYIMQTCPVFFRAYNGLGQDVVLPAVGAAISLAGLLIETLADKQKSEQKRKNPDMVAMEGLFRMVRCPNYFGEVLFWTGVFVGGLNALQGIGQWVMAVLGLVIILMVMVNGAQRLDKRQEARYGDQPIYRAYADHTPILLPLLPIYHIGRYR